MLLMAEILFCCNTDSLSAEMPKALAIAVGTTVVKAVVMEAWKSGKMIFNILKRKADDEADDETDDEADSLQNNYQKLMRLDDSLFFRERAMEDRTKKKLVTQECEAWIFGVKKIRKEVPELQNKCKSMGCDELRNKKRRSQHGSSESRTSLNKSVAETCRELGYQLEEWPKISILVERLPHLVITMRGPMQEDNPFLLPYVTRILDNLRNENVKTIALRGCQKIGKTTILKSLNNNEHVAEMFDIIIWVSASKDLDCNDLQHILADRLKLNVEGITNQDEIYHQIYRELNGKRYLLLLDEASGSFDPSWIRCYASEKDSKVVFTASSRLVCLRMQTDVEIQVEPMANAVAWEFFKGRAGRNVNLPLFKPIAERVVISCCGNPQVLDLVARKLSIMGSVGLWEEALRNIQGWSGTDIDDLGKLLSVREDLL